MMRITLVAFVVMTGFFYLTGKPAEENGRSVDVFAGLAGHDVFAERSLAKAGKEATNRSEHFPDDRMAILGGREETPPDQKVALTGGWTGTPARLDIPTRNPRRLSQPLQQARAGAPAAAALSVPALIVKAAQPRKTETEPAFEQARNKFTAATIKPLGVSYQQRFVKPATKPVLGPRLTAVLLKRQLKRLGCFSGIINGNWDAGARAAIDRFNAGTGASLSSRLPLVRSLERVQMTTGSVCAPEPKAAPTAVAAAGRLPLPARPVAQNPSSWDTSLQRPPAQENRTTAFQIFPSAVKPRYKTVGSRALAKGYAPASITRAKRARMARIRAKRLRKIRIAKRKARRRTAVRSWKRTYRRKRFGFTQNGGGLSLND